MIFEPIVFTMKDGRTAILRPPEASDAANMLACLREESGETDFILTYPEDWDSMTVAQEESFLTACRSFSRLHDADLRGGRRDRGQL